MSVDIKQQLFAAFAQHGSAVGAKPAVLIATTPGSRTPGSLGAGTNPTTTEHEALALIESSAAVMQAGSPIVRRRDAVVAIFGGSLPDGVVPRAGDSIRIEDTDGAVRTFVIVGEALPSGGPIGVAGDPVGAMYRCPCRA